MEVKWKVTPHIMWEVSIYQCIKMDLNNRLIFKENISGDLYRLSFVCLTFNVSVHMGHAAVSALCLNTTIQGKVL